MLSSWIAVLLLGAGNPHLDSARDLVKELNYLEAADVLAQARTQAGNDRTTLIEVLWLEGLVAATLGRADAARSVFRLLCSIDPDFVVPGEPPPKVMGPFFEAKGWAATMGRLKFAALPPEVSRGTIAAVAVAVTADPLKLARRIRFRLNSAGTSWYTVEATLADPRAAIAWATTELSWWAELLGENDAVLATAGSEAVPIVIRIRAEAVSPPPPAPAQGRFFGPARLTGLAAVAAGIACAIVGGVFAGKVGAAAGQVRGASRDSSGAVTGLTQKDAFAIDDRARDDSMIAIGLFAGAGALGVGGGALFAFGAP